MTPISCYKTNRKFQTESNFNGKALLLFNNSSSYVFELQLKSKNWKTTAIFINIFWSKYYSL